MCNHEIVVIEDNRGDLELIKLALNLNQHVRYVTHLQDGFQAIEFFEELVPYSAKPDLIILDLNLPKIDGCEVLKYLKSTPYLMCIPVVVLSSSNHENDIKEVYSLGANCFLSKPIDLEAFIYTIQAIGNFWLHTMLTP